MKEFTKRYILPLLAITTTCIGGYVLVKICKVWFSVCDKKESQHACTSVNSVAKENQGRHQEAVKNEPPPAQKSQPDVYYDNQPSETMQQSLDAEIPYRIELATYIRRARDGGSNPKETDQLRMTLVNYFNAIRSHFVQEEQQFISAWIEQRAYQDLLDFLID